MSKRRIQTISLSRLTNGAHSSFMNGAIEICRGSELVEEKAATDLSALETALQQENDVIAPDKADLLTEEVAKQDKIRDDGTSVYKASLKTNKRLPETNEKHQAAKRLLVHFNKFDIDTKAKYVRETGMLRNLCQDLVKSPYKEDVALLGLTDVVNMINEANDKVEQLLIERDQNRSGNREDIVSKVRKATDEKYRDLIEKINALAVIEGDDDTHYGPVIDDMNAYIKRIKQKELGAPATDPGEDPDTEEPEPEEPDDTDDEDTDNPEEPDKGDEGEEGEDGDDEDGGTHFEPVE